MVLANISKKVYDENVLLKDIAEECQSKYKSPIVAAAVDNKIRGLQEKAGQYKHLEFIELDSILGCRIYERSVRFLLIVAVRELYPKAEVFVQSSVNRGIYIELNMDEELTIEMVNKIDARMKQIIKENRSIEKHFMPKDVALKMFKSERAIPKVNLISHLSQDEVSIYYCGNVYDYLYGVMTPNTGMLDRYAIDFYKKGILLRIPTEFSNGQVPLQGKQEKFAQVLSDSKKWANLLDCRFIPDLNRHIRLGKIGEIIRLSEALHEKKIIEIAQEITNDISNRRIILIAGPSSSGKTSFAQRLKTQLMVNNVKAIAISMDDYYVNRADVPLTAEGSYDYESLEAVDVALFNEHLKKLLRGEEINPPYYNFVTGERECNTGIPLSITEDQPLIIEGIHGLNEKLTASIPRANKYKIYISALTPLNIDYHNRVHTTDARLVRRMVRDYKYRGSSAEATLMQWAEVRKGEEKNIFPFQEEADAIFNSAHVYELAALKKYAVKVLEDISPDSEYYMVARRILDFLVYFESIDDESDIPNNSLVREFIGGSCFFDAAGKLKE